MKNKITFNFLGDKFCRNKQEQFHNLNGPAIEWNNRSKNKWYFINSKQYYNFIEYIQEVIKYKNIMGKV